MANLTVSGTTSFAAASIAVAALSADTIGLTDSTGLFTVTGSPATLGGSLTLSAFASQSQNYVLAGPATGGAGAAAFRALVAADIPSAANLPLWSNLQNAAAALTLANANYATTFNQTSAVAWTWANTTAAVLATNQSSPIINLGGTYFGAAAGVLAASAVDTWSVQNVLAVPTQLSTTASITNIAETAGNVVNLTLVGSTFVPGQLVELSGFGAGYGDWLNGYTVSLITATAIVCTFTDPTSHGLLSFHVTTGTPVMTQVSGLSTLAFTHSGSSNSAVQLLNTTAATALTANASPLREFSVYYDNAGTFTGLDTWSIGSSVAAGSNGISTLTIAHTGSTGNSIIAFPSLKGELQLYNNYFSMTATTAGYGCGMIADIATTTIPAIALWNSQAFNGTAAATQYGVAIGNGAANPLTFNPASGAGSFIACYISPILEGTSSGNTTALVVNPTLTATNLTGTNLIASFQSGGSQVLGIDYSGDILNISGSVHSWNADSGISRLGAASLAIGNGTASDTTGNLSFNKVIKYAGVATISGGIPAEYATVDLTAQTGAISGGTLYTPAASGMFRVSWTADITTADSTASVLGGTNGFQVTYTSPTDSVSKTTVAGNSVTSAANTTGTAVGGCLVVYAKTGVAMTYSYGYTATTGNMAYELHIKVEAL
jgi:hypothetical protein